MTLLARLTVARGSFALDADLQVAAGEVLAVTGRNGVGKTSLLHALAGLLPATGTAQLDGRDLLALPVEQRRFAIVFQDRRLPPWLTAGAAVAMGSDRHTAADWLDRLGVAHCARTRVSRLSGGQAQRVALARALARSSSALLLDEPFQALDVASVGPVRTLVLDAARQAGVPVLLVTHDDADLAAADRALRL